MEKELKSPIKDLIRRDKILYNQKTMEHYNHPHLPLIDRMRDLIPNCFHIIMFNSREALKALEEGDIEETKRLLEEQIESSSHKYKLITEQLIDRYNEENPDVRTHEGNGGLHKNGVKYSKG